MSFEIETKVSTTVDSSFVEDVDAGLSSSPKTLPSKYFYDEIGDKIFQEIMAMPEYYLTRAEHSVFESRKQEILESIFADGRKFRLLELGAGDGQKTKVLLEHFSTKNIPFTYSPVDISGHVLTILENRIRETLPDLSLNPLVGDYFDVLSKLTYEEGTRNVVLFLGSNIGNFNNERAISFLSKLSGYLNKGDLMLVGFDLRKDPDKILSAYHDKAGITRRFNLNLLHRINKELGGNIDVDSFQHYPIYNPATGECKSYLINTEYQEFSIEATGKTYKLEAWEPIYTEVSKKYLDSEITNLAERSGFRRINDFYDRNRYFVDTLWEVV